MLRKQLFNTQPQNRNIASNEASPNHFQTSLSQNTPFFSFFYQVIFLQLLQTSTLNIRYSSKMSKNTQHLRYQIA
jgi:hypothetical protein